MAGQQESHGGDDVKGLTSSRHVRAEGRASSHLDNRQRLLQFDLDGLQEQVREGLATQRALLGALCRSGCESSRGDHTDVLHTGT